MQNQCNSVCGQRYHKRTIENLNIGQRENGGKNNFQEYDKRIFRQQFSIIGDAEDKFQL